MNQPALFANGPDPEQSRLYLAAQQHLSGLRERGLLRAEHEFLAELLLHTARAAAGQTKAYALAQLIKELREVAAALPGDQQTDPFDQLSQWLTEQTTPASDG